MGIAESWVVTLRCFFSYFWKDSWMYGPQASSVHRHFGASPHQALTNRHIHGWSWHNLNKIATGLLLKGHRVLHHFYKLGGQISTGS